MTEITPEIEALIQRKVQEELAKQASPEPEPNNKMTIIATKGTLDWAYPPFILGSTAAAADYEVTLFFTFYGLSLLKKDFSANVSPLGNPAMPMKMPWGPKWFRGIPWNIPNIMQTNVPFYETFATIAMQQTIKNNGVASIVELRDLCLEMDVRMIACQMTVDLFGYKQSDFIDGIEFSGAATWLDVASDSSLNLFT